MARSKSSGSSSKRNASSIQSGQNSGHSSHGNRPKCKLHKSFPSIKPKGCKVKARQGASSVNRSAIHSSQATPSSRGSRGSQAISESIIEPHRANQKRVRRSDNAIFKYYTKKKKPRNQKAGSATSFPFSSQYSRSS